MIKANYGLYWHNPGVGLSANVNANQSSKNITLTWNDINADRRWQPGEEGAVTANNLAGARQKDPNLKQPYTHEAGVFFEQQLAEVIGSRIGFVYKTEDDLFETYQSLRPPSVYTVPFNFADIGADNVRGTADDQNLTLYGMPSALASQYPVTQVITNAGQLGALQDGRSLDQQALREQVVGVGGRQLHDAERLPDGHVPADAESSGPLRAHDVGLQGDGFVRRALGRASVAGGASPVRFELRP